MIMDRLDSETAAGSGSDSWDRLSQRCSLEDGSLAIADQSAASSGIRVSTISHPDSDYAAKAVKIVVSNTRRGIVPLCTELADILRHKASLERCIIKLKAQNRALRYTQEYAKSQVQSDQMEQPEMDTDDDISLQSISPQLSSVSQRRSSSSNQQKQSLTLQEIKKLTLENKNIDLTRMTSEKNVKLLINKLSIYESENARLKQDLIESKESLKSSEKEVNKLKGIVASLQSIDC